MDKIKKIVCKNFKNEEVTFEYEFPFYLDNIDGIHDLVGEISSLKNAYGVGESYINTNVEKRNIVITGFIIDNFIENREKLFRVFPLKKDGTLYYYEENLARRINYKVENVDVIDKGYPKTFQISLICLDPYFKDEKNTVLHIANWIPLLTFPLFIPTPQGMRFGVKNRTKMAYIKNDTSVEFGITITFKANDVVTNPYLFNVDFREKIQIKKDMKPGDKIVITTHRNNKNIIYISSNNISENINNLKMLDSKFLQVHSGNNTFRHGADANEDNLETTIEYSKEYEAI